MSKWLREERMINKKSEINKIGQLNKNMHSNNVKPKKQKSKLTWKSVYQKCNHNRFSQVTNILETAKIKSNVGNLIKNYGKIILVAFLIIMIFLLVTFWNSLNILVFALLLMLALCIFAIAYGTYYINLEEDGVKFKINFQDNKIPYNKLIGIYLTKKKKRFFFIPIYYYALEITEYIDEEKMNIYSFPTIMLNKKEVIKFFNAFEVNVIRSEEEEEKKQNEDKKNFYKAIGIVITILLIILLIISIILYAFNN